MSFIDNITSLFKKDNGKILGIDIGSSSIKVVQLSRKKGIPVLDTFGEISLSVFANKAVGKAVNLTEEKLTEALRDLIKESQADSVNVAFSIPLKSALMFNLKIPKTISKDKLDETVRMESRKYIPVPISEVQIDWSLIPEPASRAEEKKHYDIIVIAVHRDTLVKYMNIAKNLKLDVKFLEIETFSTIRSIVRYERDTTAIVDIGSVMTKFYIVESGIIKKSHIINIGSANMLEIFQNNKVQNKTSVGDGIIGESAQLLREKLGNNNKVLPNDLVRITNEIKKAILDYQRVNSTDINNVIFTGGGVIFDPVLPYLKEQLSTSVEIANPFAKVEFPAFLENALRRTGPEFSVAVGLCLRGLSEK